MALILSDVRPDGVGIITFNDPNSLNAMSEAMALEFQGVVQSLTGAALRCVILTGSGKAFSAGGDLEMLEKKRSLGGEENRRRMLEYYDAFLSIRTLNVPIIAAMNGHAIGAGLCLACACDIRLAEKSAKLGFTFTRLGLHPGMGATYSVARVVGPAMAAELMLTARTIDANEAFRIGLISRLVEPEKVLDEALQVAAEIIASGPEATSQLLASVRDPAPTLAEALEREAVAQAVNYSSAEFAEGIRAVREKRKPVFS